MAYIITGIALYLLYRHYAKQAASQGLPASYQGDNAPSSPPDNTTPVGPPPAAPTVSWQLIPEGSQLTPGADYRASAPPQNFLVMAAIPGHLASAGFTNVVIHKPGESFPDDWPDSGDKLRIEATLPSGAQPQTLSLDGVSVWQKVVQQSAAGVAQAAIRHVAQQVYATVHPAVERLPYPNIAIPSSNGVYAGLVRPPQLR